MRARLGQLLTGCALAALTLTACGSGDSLPGSGSQAGSFGASGSSAPVSSAGAGGSDGSDGSDGSSSSGGAGSASAPAGGGTQASGDQAFCQAYDLQAVTRAGTDPAKATEVLKKVAAVAPSAIKADAELIYKVLAAATTGQAPTEDASQIRDASARVATYYAQHCR